VGRIRSTSRTADVRMIKLRIVLNLTARRARLLWDALCHRQPFRPAPSSELTELNLVRGVPEQWNMRLPWLPSSRSHRTR
jgi:hypothetical protein